VHYDVGRVLLDILGVDIGTASLKYVRWRGKRGRGIVISKGDYPYSGDWEGLERIVADIQVREGPKLDVAICVTSQNIVKKTFTIPILPKSELKEALNWSVSKVISTPLDEMTYEYAMLGEVEEKGVRKEEVVFVGAGKAYITRILSIFNHAGFVKASFITDVGSIYVPLVESVTDGSVAIIDMGGKQTGIYIFDGRKLRFTREILTASESFTDALRNSLGVTYEEAERYKAEQGFDDRSTSILFEPLERLAGEVRRTFKVYEQKYPDKPIVKVHLAGRGAKIPHFIGHLSGRLEEEVTPFTPAIDIDEAYLPPYMLCVGRDKMLNLLPREMKAKEKELKYRKWARIATAVVISVLVVLSLNQLAAYNRIKEETGIARTILTEKRERLKSLTETASMSRHRDFVAAQSEVQKRDIAFIVFMKYLSSNMPKDVYLKEVNFEGEAKVGDGRGQPSKPGAPGQNLQDVVTDTAKGPFVKVSGEGGQQIETKPAFVFTLTGYVFGDMESLEPSLVDFVVKLRQTGFIDRIEVKGKSMQDVRGRKVMEFVITGRCMRYEV
jgi:type IV pilus assembly protein PilM